MAAADIDPPADFIEAWGRDHCVDGVPSPEALKQIASALHAVQEFLVEPVLRELKRVVEDAKGTDGGYPIPEDERAISYGMIGRLITWTDELRMECRYLLDPIEDITLLAHEDLGDIAAGYMPGGSALEDRQWNKHLRRFHGLDRALSDA